MSGNQKQTHRNSIGIIMKQKIAFVGCAHIHTPYFVNCLKQRQDEFSVVALWDHDSTRAQKNAEAFDSAVIMSPGEIFSDPSIKSVVIASETNLHKDLVLEAAKAGKNLFVEKPLGYSASDAREMANAIKSAGVIFQTGYFMRGNPIHLFLREQIASGSFGCITRIRHTNCHAGSLGGWFDTDWRWMADPEQSGVGAFGDLGTHSLDIMMWLIGRPLRVAAVIKTITGRYGANCDESGEALLEFSDNLIGSLAGGWVDVSNPVSCEICGTEGHAVVFNGDLYFQSNLVPGADGKIPWKNLPAGWPHAFILYLDALTGKKVELVSVEEAAQRCEIMTAIYEAARTQTWQRC